MDQVELVLARHADDGVGEREQVLRLAEQRIRRGVDALEPQSGQPVAPAERPLAAEQRDLMVAQRQRMRQLRRDHAAAADRGVTDDADTHGSAPSLHQ
jgi:hypothetical protein